MPVWTNTLYHCVCVCACESKSANICHRCHHCLFRFCFVFSHKFNSHFFHCNFHLHSWIEIANTMATIETARNPAYAIFIIIWYCFILDVISEDYFNVYRFSLVFDTLNWKIHKKNRNFNQSKNAKRCSSLFLLLRTKKKKLIQILYACVVGTL